MKTRISIYITFLFMIVSVKSYGTSCAPSTTPNGTCATATQMTVGAACVNSETCGGGAAGSGSACISNGYGQCSYHYFIVTSTDMVVDIDITPTSGICFPRSNIWNTNGTGLCSGTELNCESGTPYDDQHILNSLTIGDTLVVQICISDAGSCSGDNAPYCISVDDYTPPPPTSSCDNCATPCGTAQGYATNPTTATVVADCSTSPFATPLITNQTETYCYDFRATATSVDFNVIITSTCGAGNVTNFSWELFNSTCGAAVQTGTLASLTFTPVVVGNDYVFCYTFTVPNPGPPTNSCNHTQHCPFFVGATVLPITLLNFTANMTDDKSVKLDWITSTEINNDYFTVEKSKDGITYEVVGIISGAGNSQSARFYNTVDIKPYDGTSYYRLAQTDYDGTTVHSKIVPVTVISDFDGLSIYPNPVEGNGYLSFNSSISSSTVNMVIYDVSGRKVLQEVFQTSKGLNKFELNTDNLPQGMYFLNIENGMGNSNIKFVKE
jgi:hypothetical protein